MLIASVGSNPTLSVGVNLHPSFEILLMSKMNEVESILSDIDALIGCYIEAEEPENARALIEEFGEWFFDYEAGKDINVMCLEVLSEQ